MKLYSIITPYVIPAMVFLAMAGHFQAAAQPSVWRSSAHLSQFHIVVPEDASPELRLAGETFKRLWEASTRRPITMSAVNEGSTNVWMGTQVLTEDMMEKEVIESLSPEEFIVRTYTPPRRASRQGAEKQMLLVGGSDTAVLHGVYAFFHEVMQVRWLAPGVTHYGRGISGMEEHDLAGRREFVLSEIGLLSLWHEDLVEYRQAHRLPAMAVSAPGAPDYFEALLDSSGTAAEPRSPVAYGTTQGAHHVLRHILELAGAQDAEAQQTLRHRRNKARGHFSGNTVWHLAAMDWLHPVLTPEGQALNTKEGTPAACIIALANEVAEGLAEALPDETHLVHVLLSPTMQTPPARLRPHPHVIVQLSTAATNFAAPLSHRQCDINRPFVEHLTGWHALGARIHIFDHLTNLRDPRLPFPSFDALQANLLLYARYDVEGLYYAGVDVAAPEEVDLAALRIYLAASLMADPDIIFETCLDDFLTRYYGAAASSVRDYLALLRNSLRAYGGTLRSYDRGAWLDDHTLDTASTLLAEAQSKQLDDHIRARVAAMEATLAYVRQTRGS